MPSVQSQSHNNPISSPPPSLGAPCPLQARARRRDFHMGKLREFVSPQAALPSERPPEAPLDNLTSLPPGPQPGAVSPISHQAWPGTPGGLGHTTLHSQSFSFSSNAVVPTSSNKLSGCEPFADHLTSPLPPSSLAKHHPSVPPSRPSHHAPSQRNPPASRPNELEARGPPFLLPSRSITDPALSLHCTPPPSQQPSLPPPRLISIPLPSQEEGKASGPLSLSIVPPSSFSRPPHMALLRAEICHAHTHTSAMPFCWELVRLRSRTGATARELCTTPKIGRSTTGTGCWVRGTVPLVAPWSSRALFWLFPDTCTVQPALPTYPPEGNSQ